MGCEASCPPRAGGRETGGGEEEKGSGEMAEGAPSLELEVVHLVPRLTLLQLPGVRYVSAAQELTPLLAHFR